MPLTRLTNLALSKTGRIIYVNPDDFNATDDLDNRGNSNLRPFKSIQRAFIEVARFSYLPGARNDRFDQFTIQLYPGTYYIDNRPGVAGTDEINELLYEFDTNQWTDTSILDIANKDNILYKFNNREGGAIIPRGSSLVGWDLRRTIIRPLYVPDPVSRTTPRTSIFNVTGGCWFFGFTTLDGDYRNTSPLYDRDTNSGLVYYDLTDWNKLRKPLYSHHKITVFEYVDKVELDLFYKKVAKAFARFQPTIDDSDTELDERIEETRIVGPLSDTYDIEELLLTDDEVLDSITNVQVTTKVDHGYFVGQFIEVRNTGIDDLLEGVFEVTKISEQNPRIFEYQVPVAVSGLGGSVTFLSPARINKRSIPEIGEQAQTIAEIDTVESSSPYVFNCSIRSEWGLCGMWANGLKATGFRSMVVAQFTGVSLQKDDRAFIRFNEFNNTWNQASLKDAFAPVPYHTKGDAYWKDSWRTFHIRASNDSFIQCVSVFCIGQADHFLLESGGDMSITNSNSNFGNTSLHAIGFKRYSFNQNKNGYISHIVSPKELPNPDIVTPKKVNYYIIDIKNTIGDETNNRKLYIGGDDNETIDPYVKPASKIDGYKIGGRHDDKIYVNLDRANSGFNGPFYARLRPSGFRKYLAKPNNFSPREANAGRDKFFDAANLIESNREFIQDETFGYILERYSRLRNLDIVFPDKSENERDNFESSLCYRDIGYVLDAVVNDLRVGGNLRSIKVGESYRDALSGNLIHIANESLETIEAYKYAANAFIAAMRNFRFEYTQCFTLEDSAIVTGFAPNHGIMIGMKVTQKNGATDTIPENTYVKNIIEKTDRRGNAVYEIELGRKGSNLDNGDIVLAKQTSVFGIHLKFEFDDNIVWSPRGISTDESITREDNEPVCRDISIAIGQRVKDILDTINGQEVEFIDPVVDASALFNTTTIFDIDPDANGASRPHGIRTGTPVRLVPRPKFDEVTGRYKDIASERVRLPKGFETNKVYYVINCGRETQPYDYSKETRTVITPSIVPGRRTTVEQTIFSAAETTRLMLATSRQNAQVGIYIYSPEADTIDPDVEIDLYQFVSDQDYDLDVFNCVDAANTGLIETSSFHNIDIPQSINQINSTRLFFRSVAGVNSLLPAVTDDLKTDREIADAAGRLRGDKYFYARYKDRKRFSIYKTLQESIRDQNPVTFDFTNEQFNVILEKTTTPLRFDPSVRVSDDPSEDKGKWFLNTSNSHSDSIIQRLREDDDYESRLKSTDTFFERIEDLRDKKDKIYRLRYVLDKNFVNAAPPFNGYTLKKRTDDTRQLLPQRIVIAGEPTLEINNLGSPYFTEEELRDKNIDPLFSYDSYLPQNEKNFITTDSGLIATVESGKVYTDSEKYGDGTFTELIVYDYDINKDKYVALSDERITFVEIKKPEGGTGDFVSDKTLISVNTIRWEGYSTGKGHVVAFIKHNEGEDDERFFLAIVVSKGISNLAFSDEYLFDDAKKTTFVQDDVRAVLIDYPDFGKSLPLPELQEFGLEEYYFARRGARAFTLVPGDKITDDNGETFDIVSVEDEDDFENTYYVYDSEVIQDHIPNQQDGIYYLTVLRGNVSTAVESSGVGSNFSNFKFSQPIPSLYPRDVVDDPYWFRYDGYGGDEADYLGRLKDPLPSYSAADNFLHGLVTVNNNKNSTTREAITELLKENQFKDYEYQIEALPGPASLGAENRLISISGNEEVVAKRKVYVEFRRPSIARAGNHTFEYLGYGPGNYSTAMPIRQQAAPTPLQDFYAQSKKQDAGVVFYTGINSSGDLYTGNKKTNAITGEDTFLESAEPVDEDDDPSDNISSIGETRTTPITFEKNITVVGGDGGTLINTFSSPVELNVKYESLELVRDLDYPLTIRSDISFSGTDDYYLDRQYYEPNERGDIVLGKNLVRAGSFGLAGRANTQSYTIKTNYMRGVLSQNQTPFVGNADPLKKDVDFGNAIAESGTIVLRGENVEETGSAGWIYTNSNISAIQTPLQNIAQLRFDSIEDIVEVIWKSPRTNAGEGVTVFSEVTLKDFTSGYDFLNKRWKVRKIHETVPFDPTANSFYLEGNPVTSTAVDLTIALDTVGGMQISRPQWKEIGVIGSESIRTYTTESTDPDDPKDYRVGINTLSRANDTDYQNGYVNERTVPKATLDVVGNAIISGENKDHVLLIGVQSVDVLNNNFGNRLPFRITKKEVDSTLGVANYVAPQTSINYTSLYQFSNYQLNIGGSVHIDSPLVAVRKDIEVAVDGDGTGDIDLFSQSIPSRTDLRDKEDYIGNLSIARNATKISIGDIRTSELDIGTKSNSSFTANIGNVGSNNELTTSKITIGGGAANNESNSFTKINTRVLDATGDLKIGSGRQLTEEVLITSNAGTVRFLGDQTATLYFAPSSSKIEIGSAAGTTTINNQLKIGSSFEVVGSFEMVGGSDASTYAVLRGQMGTGVSAHLEGSVGSPNVDVIVLDDKLDSQLKFIIDTPGNQDWGTSVYKRRIEGTDTTDLDDPSEINHYWLPFSFSPNIAGLTNRQLDEELRVDDYLFISGTRNQEVVKVLDVSRTKGVGGTPRIIKVERNPFGAYAPGTVFNTIRYEDSSEIRKVTYVRNASWLIDSILAGTSEFELGQFSGSVTVGDWFILSNKEFVRISELKNQVQRRFSIYESLNKDNATVDIETSTGNTTIKGDLEIGGTLNIKTNLEVEGDTTFTGGISITGPTTFTGDITGQSGTLRSLHIDAAEDTDLNRPIFRIADKTIDSTLVPPAPKNNQLFAVDRIGIVTVHNNIETEEEISIITPKFKYLHDADFFYVNGATGIRGNIVNYGETYNNPDPTAIVSDHPSRQFSVVDGIGYFSDRLGIGIDAAPTHRFRIAKFGTDETGAETDYVMREDGSVSAYGIDNWRTTRGGYSAQRVQAGDRQLLYPNVTYFFFPLANVRESEITLPEDVENGDWVRFIVAGELTYNVRVIMKGFTGHKIQNVEGDDFIITTPNAAFTLHFYNSIWYLGEL